MARKQLILRFIVSVLAIGIAGLARGQSLANPASLPHVAPSAPGPTTYGTAATSYLTIFDTQFAPLDSTVTYDDLGNGATRASRYATGGSGAFIAAANLPNGALITALEVDACDSNGGGSHVVGLLGSCDIFGNNCALIGNQVLSVSNPITPCAQISEDLNSVNYTVNNLTGRVFVEVVTQSGDNTNSISGALVGYKLQVSPGPGVATFNDVPLSDFGFQFVEAFAAAGITVGCTSNPPFTPPVFCPDRNVTRREMAIFFAKALGLQFP